jgi:hypothetical protein
LSPKSETFSAMSARVSSPPAGAIERCQSHLKAVAGFVFEGDEPKRLQTPRATLDSWLEDFSHTLHRTIVGWECQLDKLAFVKWLR